MTSFFVAGGELRPGDGGAGAAIREFAVENLTLGSSGSVWVNLDPSTGASDLVRVENVASLGGILFINLGSEPTVGQSFLIVENFGSDPVVDQFRNDLTVVGFWGMIDLFRLVSLTMQTMGMTWQ